MHASISESRTIENLNDFFKEFQTNMRSKSKIDSFDGQCTMRANMKVSKSFKICSRCLLLKFIYSEKATKFCKIFPLLLTGTTLDKSKVKISQNLVAFSKYINFTKMVANSLIENTPKCPKVYLSCPICLPKPKTLGIR